MKNLIIFLIFFNFFIFQLTAENLSILPSSKIFSSSEYSNRNYSKEFAKDGNETTVWGSALEDEKPYLIIDLGKISKIEKLVIKWKKPFFAKKFILGASNDFKTWLVSSEKSGTGDVFELDILKYDKYKNLYYRYVAVQSTERNSNAIGIEEFEVWGRDAVIVDFPDANLEKKIRETIKKTGR